MVELASRGAGWSRQGDLGSEGPEAGDALGSRADFYGSRLPPPLPPRSWPERRGRADGGGADNLTSVPISRHLLDDEEDVLVDVRPHWVYLSGPAALTMLALAGAIAIGFEFPQAPVDVVWVLVAMVAIPALWLVARVIKWLGVSIVVTTHRLVYRRGIIRRDVVQLRLQRIAEVHLNQSVLDRLIGAGRLVVEVQGDPQPLLVDDLRRPRSIQRVLNRQLDQLDLGSARSAGSPPPEREPVAPLAAPRSSLLETTPPHGTVVRARPPGELPPNPAEQTPTSPTSPTSHRACSTGVEPVESGPTAQALVDLGTSAPPPLAGSIPGQLIQLDELRRRGIITEAEFAAKKTELLRRL
jgi:membrane protein YdbS with pleckstrin-like domain